MYSFCCWCNAFGGSRLQPLPGGNHMMSHDWYIPSVFLLKYPLVERKVNVFSFRWPEVLLLKSCSLSATGVPPSKADCNLMFEMFWDPFIWMCKE
jgi:hypothetical protein